MAAEGLQITRKPSIAAVLAELRELRAMLAVVVEKQRTLPAGPMTPAEFAKAIGKSEKTVRRWITKGKLRAQHVGRTTLISPVNAARFLEGGKERA